MPWRVRKAPASATAKPAGHLAADEALFVLARDRQVHAATEGAARLLSAQPPRDAGSVREALARIMAPGRRTTRLVMEVGAAGLHWPALLAVASDPFAPGTLVLIQPDGTPVPFGVGSAEAAEAPIAAALTSLPGNLPTDVAEDAEDLLRGLKQGEIVLRYQPIVRLSDGRPMLLEALARWQRLTAPLPPDAFVPLAERSGLGRALSVVVARRAAAELGALRPGFRQPVSINLPLGVLLEQDTVSWLGGALEGTGMVPSDLVLELTETTPIHDLPLLRRALTRLRRAGHRILLDDMALDDGRLLLLGLPFDGVKIDRDFTAALPHSHRARAAVRNIVRIAHAKGMTVTAEGVADARLWRAVASLGVDYAQGWAVGRPLPAPALGAWLSSWSSGTLN
ncbi:EAL domain-containing protein (putative c-di-GMP-specific phosphodiesterase class I) [Humitalea rosea]|uniref:EAL domain-containing protein (Putative c-di-GMP-specific phosphodiesterase class I) n=1 Tax=Humitalea rosea TaxID=990373 RepID=A0A2W7II52_9PROT|nr:EAL domain-containing protein [Humitalea rosea]PZW37649.1 EAL domain-containing protein (putative c-di-GMP-specific phosphodiesterase class I) [Humitalea rosea]